MFSEYFISCNLSHGRRIYPIEKDSKSMASIRIGSASDIGVILWYCRVANRSE